MRPNKVHWCLCREYTEKQTDDLLLGGDNLWVGKHVFGGALFPAHNVEKKNGRRLSLPAKKKVYIENYCKYTRAAFM